MCQHHAPTPPSERAVSLDHGDAHDHDHDAWSRRDFLATAGLVTAGTSFALGNTTARAMGRSSVLHALSQLDTDRVLVLVQLKGGNDGLNTIVPVTNDLYYNARPTIAVAPSDTRRLTDDLGLNAVLAPWMRFWNQERMAVVNGVGYPDPSLSHFVSTDTWLTGEVQTRTTNLTTGWVGRYNDLLHPDEQPSIPPAIQVRARLPLLSAGDQTNMMMSIRDGEALETLAERGIYYDPSTVSDFPVGNRLGYIRTVANLSERYVGTVQAAARAATVGVGYDDDAFSQDLAAVARLIKGRLGTKVYVVTLGSFDTHVDQVNRHAVLYDQLGKGIRAFFDDLATTGDDRRVAMMTFSEFGRRINENGSSGTDHGEAAPVFLFGGGGTIAGGLYGSMPSLDAENLPFQTDFRSLYATLLNQWFGLSSTATSESLGGVGTALPLIANPVRSEPRAPEAPRTKLTAYPNPIRSDARVSFSMRAAGPVRLDVLDLRGRLVMTIEARTRTAGTHVVPFERGRLAAGAYVLRLQTPEGIQTRTVTLAR
ncbi:MAG: DUF1501 domain-containing protein [Bacteroidota bacterium]